MRSKGAAGIGLALAALAATPAMAADELSVEQRLQDRREVAAGTRAQVLGFQDGRFYAQGWHITGEMGGIVTPPLKLLDSVSFGVDGQWIGSATRFTSGKGYVTYDLPATAGIRLRRTDVAPDGRRGALLGLTLRNPRAGRRTVTVRVDAHSELMGQYPWTDTTPSARENLPDTGRFDGDALVFRDRGQLPGEARPHDFTALVGSDRAPVRGSAGPGGYGPHGAGRVCASQPDDTRLPSRCDDGPFGKGTGGRLEYRVKLRGGKATTLWIAVAGSDVSPGAARAELARLTRDPERALRRKRAARRQLDRWTRLRLPGDPRLAESIEWGKQNLADLTQEATGLDLRWTNQGREWTRVGALPRMRWIGAGFPDYPWLFAVDGEYTTHAAVSLGQFEAIADHLRALRDVSDQLNDRSGVVVHEVVADGSIYHGRDSRETNPRTGELEYDFNTDEIVKFPAAVALVWRWTGDDGFRDEMLDFMRRNLDYVAMRLDADGDGWPEGNGNVERPGMGEEKLDNAVYYIRALYDYADMARSAGQGGRAAAAEARADDLAGRFEATWWMEDQGAYADSLTDPGNVPTNQKHWIGATPMEAELTIDGEVVPGLASYEHGSAGLATRENSCYSGERPGNRGLFHTGCGGGPRGEGEFNIFSIGTGIMAVGEGNYGRLGAEQQRRYTDANAETQFGQPATGGTPDEQPGAMPEIFPSNTPEGRVGTAPNIDRCWTCRSMFMQAWGHYGTAWSVVHQGLGVRPDLGHGRLEVMPRVPDGQPALRGTSIRLGDGSVDVAAARGDGRYVTRVAQHGAPASTLLVGHTLPRGATVGTVTLDGRATRSFTARATSRGLEVRVAASPRGRHTLVVTAG
jgi:hypothetical protein